MNSKPKTKTSVVTSIRGKRVTLRRRDSNKRWSETLAEHILARVNSRRTATRMLDACYRTLSKANERLDLDPLEIPANRLWEMLKNPQPSREIVASRRAWQIRRAAVQIVISRLEIAIH